MTGEKWRRAVAAAHHARTEGETIKPEQARPCPTVVIPGRREAPGPESIFTDRGYGFRARAFGAPRNDGHC
jgi:hypothetical protein